ncbi:hypothetical protein DQ04_07711000 [Trypanosoma grayi]|uniref:hypothetical protein n=1 Tax=Trypanosoma grayi TaxID=71804 RepID=UPI0004F4932B|nr:hypothetical protein DQ04_07711000 [Trypanosoma grayi]KEG08214.1 hypothetical protein DQ04_07711000 [Trypanosoma grayi]
MCVPQENTLPHRAARGGGGEKNERITGGEGAKSCGGPHAHTAATNPTTSSSNGSSTTHTAWRRGGSSARRSVKGDTKGGESRTHREGGARTSRHTPATTRAHRFIEPSPHTRRGATVNRTESPSLPHPPPIKASYPATAVMLTAARCLPACASVWAYGHTHGGSIHWRCQLSHCATDGTFLSSLRHCTNPVLTGTFLSPSLPPPARMHQWVQTFSPYVCLMGVGVCAMSPLAVPLHFP